MKEHLLANDPSGKQLYSKHFYKCSLKYITSPPHVLTEIIYANIHGN